MLHCGRPSAERWASQNSDPEEAAVFVDDGVQVLGRSGETVEIWRRIGMRAAAFPLSCVHVQPFYCGGNLMVLFIFFNWNLEAAIYSDVNLKYPLQKRIINTKHIIRIFF